MLLGALAGILLVSLSLVGQVNANGKHISECTLDPNCLVL
jgi:hypothetical protein